MQQNKTSKLGLSLVEILFFLGIISGIVAVCLYYLGYIGIGAKVNTVLDKIQEINTTIATMQSAQGTSTRSLSNSQLESMLPENTMLTPWGEKIVLAGTSSNSYTMTIPMMPASICHKLLAKLSDNSHYDLTATECPEDKEATVSFTYTYYMADQNS